MKIDIYKNKYLGENKIISWKEIDGYIEISFKDKKEMWSKVLIEKCKTDKVSDATTLRDERIWKTNELVLELLKELNLKYSEMQYLTQNLIGSLNQSADKCDEILYGTKDKDLLLMDTIIKNGTTPTGKKLNK